MDGRQMDKDLNSSPSMPTISPSSEQSPELTTTDKVPNLVARQSEPNSKKKQRVTKEIRKLGIASLIIGITVFVGLSLSYVIFDEHTNESFIGIVFFLLYSLFFYVYVYYTGTIACIVLLIIILVDMVKYKIKPSKYVFMAIVGLVLTLLPLIMSIFKG